MQDEDTRKLVAAADTWLANHHCEICDENEEEEDDDGWCDAGTVVRDILDVLT